MMTKLVRMRATIGYACTPGPPTVEKGCVAIAWEATNMPVESCIDWFVARVDDPGNSIGCTDAEIDIIMDCETCEVCDALSGDVLCSDCKQDAAEWERNKGRG